MELSPILLESFRRNGGVNAALLEHLTAPDLEFSDGQGGMSVGQHLEHLVGFRRGWLEHIAPVYAERIQHVTLEGNNPIWKVTLDLTDLEAAFLEGDAIALEAVHNAYSERRKFVGAYESDPAHFLQHTLVHDAHHRGQIMTLLRQGGRSLEQMNAIEEATWPIWRK